MKPVPNKKHRARYRPVEVYQIRVIVDCDVGNGYTNTISRRLPLERIVARNPCRDGAVIDVGTLNVAAKWFKSIRLKKDFCG